MASKENKSKYNEEEVSTVTLKKPQALSDYNDSSKEVSSKEEPARRPRSDDGDTTDSENDDDNDGSDDNSDDQLSDDAFD
jgi:hypothetical protein